MTPEQRTPIRVNPSITGAYGGYTIDFRRFAADGITLLGRVQAARDGVLDDRPRSRRESGQRRSRLYDLPRHDGRACPTARPRSARGSLRPGDACRSRLVSPIRCSASTSAGNIEAVIWATGYGVDFSWIEHPGPGCARRTGPPGRHYRGTGAVFPRPAVAVENEFRLPVRRRRRRGRARRSYRRPRAEFRRVRRNLRRM